MPATLCFSYLVIVLLELHFVSYIYHISSKDTSPVYLHFNIYLDHIFTSVIWSQIPRNNWSGYTNVFWGDEGATQSTVLQRRGPGNWRPGTCLLIFSSFIIKILYPLIWKSVTLQYCHKKWKPNVLWFWLLSLRSSLWL